LLGRKILNILKIISDVNSSFLINFGLYLQKNGLFFPFFLLSSSLSSLPLLILSLPVPSLPIVFYHSTFIILSLSFCLYQLYFYYFISINSASTDSILSFYFYQFYFYQLYFYRFYFYQLYLYQFYFYHSISTDSILLFYFYQLCLYRFYFIILPLSALSLLFYFY
jgi:hypothetical protein